MKKIKLLLSVFALLTVYNLQANDDEITLRFTTNYVCSWHPLDSIVVENLTQDAEKILYYPDTVLVLPFSTDIGEIHGTYNDLYVSQNYPNPFSKKTHIDIGVAEKDVFTINVYDITGRKLTSYNAELEPSVHNFTFYSCSEQTYILTVTSNKHIEKQLMVQVGQSSERSSRIEYNGAKIKTETRSRTNKSDFPFNPGDVLKFSGYIDGLHDEKVEIPSEDTDYLFEIISTAPVTPNALDAIDIGYEYFTANWEAVEDFAVTHYLLDVSEESDFSTYILEQENVGNVTEYQVTGLEFSTEYYYRVYAVNCCGTSDASNVIFVETEEPCYGIEDVTFMYNGEQVSYLTVATSTGKCWLDRDLGSVSYDAGNPDTHGPSSQTDYNFYGDFFQWGRLADGHQLINWTCGDSDDCATAEHGTTADLSSFDNPGHNEFITNGENPYDWRDDNNNNRWNADPIVNNPCPNGWRVPTADEWIDVSADWGGTDDAFDSELKLTNAGIRHKNDGLVVAVGAVGGYWSSNVEIATSLAMTLTSIRAQMYDEYRAYAYSVRCIMDLDLFCPEPSAPTATDATDVEENSFMANWEAVTADPAISHYLLDVSTDSEFSSFVDDYEQKDVGDNTNHQVTGLEPDTEYYYRVYAVNDCGTSDFSDVVSVETEPESEPFECDEITFTYNEGTDYEEELTYCKIESSVTGRIWMDRNLGAVSFDEGNSDTHVPSSKTDYNFYGDLFQWGREDDGHQVINWIDSENSDGEEQNRETDVIATTDQPDHDDFIMSLDIPYDWRNDNNDNRWNANPIENNPCPEGWSVPIEQEWIDEAGFEDNGWENFDDAFNSDLKLSVAGFRMSVNGTLYDASVLGLYWSSTVDGTGSATLRLVSSNAYMTRSGRAHGYSVRCIKDDEPPCSEPDIPTATDATDVEENSFMANWEAVTADPAISHYLLDVSTDSEFSSFVDDYEQRDVGYNTNHQVTDLEPDTEYYYRVYAVNDCGTSDFSDVVSVETEPESEPFECGDNITFTYNGEDVTYGTVESSETGRCWIDRNLGAVSYDEANPDTHVPESKFDYDFYGDLFQWGREDDGHQVINWISSTESDGEEQSRVTNDAATNDQPGHDNFILAVFANNFDWREDNNNNRWNIGDNNPCPDGWYVPTTDDWEAESADWDNSDDAFASDLKMTVIAYRSGGNGLFNGIGNGYYWTSSVFDEGSYNFEISVGSAGISGYYRSLGMSVRCVKE